jgi:hypothetical protein
MHFCCLLCFVKLNGCNYQLINQTKHSNQTFCVSEFVCFCACYVLCSIYSEEIFCFLCFTK